MITEIATIIALGIVGSIFVAFGGWSLPIIVYQGFTEAIMYFNTFLGIVPPLRIVLQLFILGLLMELMLMLLKFFLGSKVPTID